MNLKRGFFATFDGPNGVGKSTILTSVSSNLRSKNLDVLLTKEPTDSEFGIFFRECEATIRGNSYACIAAADRYYHIEKIIKPGLKANKIVLSDRYVESSLVLQRMDEVDQNFIWELNKQVITPDLSIIFTTAPEILKQRLKLRDKLSFFEKSEASSERELEYYLQASKFLKSKGYNILVLDNDSTTIEENTGLICTKILDLIRRYGNN